MKNKSYVLRRIGTVFFIVLAMGLIAVGVYSNQFQSVLTKATRICLECIGIG